PQRRGVRRHGMPAGEGRRVALGSRGEARRQICAFGYRRYAALRGLSRGCVCASAGDQIRYARMMTRNGLMHLHILGICGSFMGCLAAIAKASRHIVTGCDDYAYPPMSTQLEELIIAL